VYEVCALALKKGWLTDGDLSRIMNIKVRRAREILLELVRMNLLSTQDGKFHVNENTKKIVCLFNQDDREGIHSYLLDHYSFYRDLIYVLEQHIDDERGLSIHEILTEGRNLGLNLNRTAVEVLVDWCERLGIVQRHLYSGRIYIVRKGKPSSEVFRDCLLASYDKFVQKEDIVYVAIPKLREDVCERLKISREVFDELLKELYLKNVGKIELCGAPIVTSAKEIPFKMKILSSVQVDKTVASPGLKIADRIYYYLAIFDYEITV